MTAAFFVTLAFWLALMLFNLACALAARALGGPKHNALFDHMPAQWFWSLVMLVLHLLALSHWGH